MSAHLRFFQPRQADFDAIEAFSQFVYEFVVNAALYEDTGTGAADLALVEEDAEFGAFHSHVPFAVFKEDVGRFTAKFQRSRNQFFLSRLVDVAADFRRAREGQFLDVRMVEEVLAGAGALAGNDVDDTVRQDAF